ncbi:MAG: BTAD domain-containing putative transcriptional regulator [Xanthobacteraceae bacterium]
MFSVRMLGVLTISVDGRRIADDLGPSGRTLTAFLFESIGRSHRRERLADQFWGHLDPERARAALNTALWRFRKLLALDPRSDGGKILHTNGSDVILEQAPWLDIDTVRFSAAMKRLLDRHARQKLEPDAFMSELKAAIDDYTGPFLDGEDADWILEERERLHSLFIRAATELVRHYGSLNLYEDAIAVARRILAVDPFRESVHRDLVILLLLNGQRGEALRQHDRWRVRLQEELGIGPIPQTTRLVDDIRSGKIFERIEALRLEHFTTAVVTSATPTSPAAPRLAFTSDRTMSRSAAGSPSDKLVFDGGNSAAADR